MNFVMWEMMLISGRSRALLTVDELCDVGNDADIRQIESSTYRR